MAHFPSFKKLKIDETEMYLDFVIEISDKSDDFLSTEEKFRVNKAIAQAHKVLRIQPRNMFLVKFSFIMTN